MQSINPYTGEMIKEYAILSLDEALGALKESRIAQVGWSKLEISGRAAFLKKVAQILRHKKQHYAELITSEMGKVIRESLAEVEKCALCCEYYAENAEHFLKPEHVQTESHKSLVLFEPLGVIFAIMPWNFPFWQAFRCIAPAIISGNSVLLKHASNVPGCALAIEECLREAGVPEGVFKSLLISSEIAMKLVAHIDAVSITGSNKAGEAIGKLAGEHIKPMVLELGGSDPFIILDDADIERAAQAAVKSRFLNCGQSCIAAKRFIVVDKVAKEFEYAFVEAMKKLKVGNPLDPSMDIGPIAKQEFIAGLEMQLADAKQKGARVLFQSKIPSNGFFFAPTALINVRQQMRVLSEEVFGPIAPIVIVKTEEEALQIACDTPYGLGASLWTRNLEKAERLAKRIDAGTVAINDIVKSNPRLPFGGIKKSGIGRELSHYGLKEFVNIKTVYMQP